MNKLILLGRLGKDGELAYSADGKPRLTFTVATDHGSGGKQTVTLEVVRKGKSATEVYHEGVAK